MLTYKHETDMNRQKSSDVKVHGGLTWVNALFKGIHNFTLDGRGDDHVDKKKYKYCTKIVNHYRQ
ncbi:MAG: hypothetical protein ACOC80_06730 [Petrotogales bacterium]